MTNKFAQFSDYRFAQEIVTGINDIRERLTDKENNVHLLHFLAKSGYGVRIGNIHYPIFTENGNSMDSYNHKKIHLPNTLGLEFAEQEWVGDGWLNFVDKSYFDNDPDDMRIFFKNQGIAGVDDYWNPYVKHLMSKWISSMEVPNISKDMGKFSIEVQKSEGVSGLIIYT